MARRMRGTKPLTAFATPGTDMAIAAASDNGLSRVSSDARKERRASPERPSAARQ